MRTIEEVREYCKKELSRLETQMDDPIKRRFLGNLVQQDGAEWHGVKGVLDFIDSGESDDVCVWTYKEYVGKSELKGYKASCGIVFGLSYKNDIVCQSCGRKIKREE